MNRWENMRIEKSEVVTAIENKQPNPKPNPNINPEPNPEVATAIETKKAELDTRRSQTNEKHIFLMNKIKAEIEENQAEAIP